MINRYIYKSAKKNSENIIGTKYELEVLLKQESQSHYKNNILDKNKKNNREQQRKFREKIKIKNNVIETLE